MTAVTQRNRSRVPHNGAFPVGQLFALSIARCKETRTTTSVSISFSRLFKSAAVPAHPSPAMSDHVSPAEQYTLGQQVPHPGRTFCPGQQIAGRITNNHPAASPPTRATVYWHYGSWTWKSCSPGLQLWELSRTHCVLPPKHSLAKKVGERGVYWNYRGFQAHHHSYKPKVSANNYSLH